MQIGAVKIQQTDRVHGYLSRHRLTDKNHSLTVHRTFALFPKFLQEMMHPQENKTLGLPEEIRIISLGNIVQYIIGQFLRMLFDKIAKLLKIHTAEIKHQGRRLHHIVFVSFFYCRSA